MLKNTKKPNKKRQVKEAQLGDPEECPQMIQEKKKTKKAEKKYRTPNKGTEKMYEVEAIIKERKNRNGQYEYLIKWEGYSHQQNTWEPVEHISQSLLKEFKENQNRRQTSSKDQSSKDRLSKDKLNKEQTKDRIKSKGQDKLKEINNQQQATQPSYQVEKIVSKVKKGNKWLYLVKWMGYDLQDCTMEPLENIKDAQDKIDLFEQQIKGRKILKINSKNPSTSRGRAENSHISKQEKSANNRQVKIKSPDKATSVSNKSNSNSSKKEYLQINNAQQQKPKRKYMIRIVKQCTSTAQQEEQTQTQTLPQKMIVQGSLENNDVPELIEYMDKDEQTQQYLCFVRWRQSEDKIIQPTIVDKDKLTIKYPYILLDFYERNIKFCNENSTLHSYQSPEKCQMPNAQGQIQELTQETQQLNFSSKQEYDIQQEKQLE